MNGYDAAMAVEPVAAMLAGADRKDVRTVVSAMTLPEFVAAAISWRPWWVRLLFKVRGALVLLFGERQELADVREDMRPEAVPFQPGGKAGIFTVLAAEQGRFWLSEARDERIAGGLGVVMEPLPDGAARFHVLTTATFLRPSGAVYFRIIEPFHHLIMHCMLRHIAQRC